MCGPLTPDQTCLVQLLASSWPMVTAATPTKQSETPPSAAGTRPVRCEKRPQSLAARRARPAKPHVPLLLIGTILGLLIAVIVYLFAMYRIWFEAEVPIKKIPPSLASTAPSPSSDKHGDSRCATCTSCKASPLKHPAEGIAAAVLMALDGIVGDPEKEKAFMERALRDHHLNDGDKDEL